MAERKLEQVYMELVNSRTNTAKFYEITMYSSSSSIGRRLYIVKARHGRIGNNGRTIVKKRTIQRSIALRYLRGLAREKRYKGYCQVSKPSQAEAKEKVPAKRRKKKTRSPSLQRFATLLSE